MKNLKGLILCSGGFSSSIISEKLNELGKEYNMKFDEGGYGMDSISSLGDKYDMILFAPHLSMYYDEYEDELEAKGTPLFQISSSEYVVSNVDKLFDRILEKFEIK